MKIDLVKATGIELTEAIKSAVTQELSSLEPMTARFNGAASANVEVGKMTQHHRTGPFFRAEINLQIPGKLLRAEAEHEDLYTALKDAVKTMHQELAKDKGKHDDARRA